MKKRVFTLLLAAGLLAVAAFTALTFPASAQTQTVYVKLPSGEVVPVTVDVPPGSSLDDIQLPGTPVPAPPAPETPTTPTVPTVPKPAPQTDPAPKPNGGNDGPSSNGGSEQERSSSGRRVQEKRDKSGELVGEAEGRAKDEISKAKRRGRRSPLRNADGTPTPGNPGFTDVLPGPSTATGVPNFIIRKFRVPPFLLSIYQAAGIEYGVRWEILAAINEIETDYGRNLNVSSAGALGWMQFMPSTWKMYGTDANKDGRKDPYNPVDAIFAAARYLKAAGYEQDVRRSIFAYNHADWYVDSVLLRARLIAGVPADVIGSLTGLTEGRFPVFARARYADDIAERQLMKRVQRGENAANIIESDDARRSIDIFAKKGAPVVAVNDGVIKKIGRNKKLGRHVVLQDVYGNRYTYAHLGTISKLLSGAEARRRRARPQAQRPGARREPGRPGAGSGSFGRPPARLLRQEEGEGPRRRRAGGRHAGVRAREGAPVRPPGSAGRPRGRRPRAAARRPGAPERQVRDLQDLLLAPVRPRPVQGPPAPAEEGLPRDRRHDPRPHRPAASRARPLTSTSPSAPRAAALRTSTRSRSSTAGSCSRPPRSTAPPAATCSTARTAPARCRSARSCCCRSRCSRSASSPTSASRSTSAGVTTSAPARSTAACSRRSPTSPSPASARR